MQKTSSIIKVLIQFSGFKFKAVILIQGRSVLLKKKTQTNQKNPEKSRVAKITQQALLVPQKEKKIKKILCFAKRTEHKFQIVSSYHHVNKL